jgi:GNAT superfamily N-acetyltransferase
MIEVSVRKATADDTTTVASAMANAFGEDPVFCWMSGQADNEKRMGPFWRAFIKLELARSEHEVFVTEDGTSAAVWKGIDKWKVPQLEMLRAAPAMIASLRTRLIAGLKMITAMEKVHPTEPHYYLEMLGTRRDRQGKGGGSAVIQAMLDRCDTEGVPAYLESSNPRNIPFYVRHGFVETRVIDGPRGAPVVTAMWREPR